MTADAGAVDPSATSEPVPSNLTNRIVCYQKGEHEQQSTAAISSNSTFGKSASIFLNEPIGSMSLSPANRDVVLAARKGLYIVDLESPYAPPRFLVQLSSWEAADVQWSPHPARSHWVASTSNDRLLIWNLDRPEGAPRGPTPSFAAVSEGGTPSAKNTLHAKLFKQSGTSLPSSNVSSELGKSSGSPAYGLTSYPHHQVSPAFFRSSAIEYVLQAHSRAITDINFSEHHPDILASCGIDTWSWVWDLRCASKPVQGYSAWNAPATQIKWNRSSPHRLATAVTNKVLVWDDRKGALPLATIEAHENQIYGLDWSRNTSDAGLNKLVTCSLDGAVKFWDLGAPASQEAIGSRALVTEPEQVIQTATPIWRARHLPFGSGVMTLPQRGDLSLSMWSKEHPECGPVERFVGHKDIVKEYLFRTRHGPNSDSDDRRFQLITWSKDQTLRLWPVSEEAMKRVGHKAGAPIKVFQTRKDAPDISYRDPPSHHFNQKGIDVSISTNESSSVHRSSTMLPTEATNGLMRNRGAALPRLTGGKVAGSPGSGHRGNESTFGAMPKFLWSGTPSHRGSLLSTSTAATPGEERLSVSLSRSLSRSLQAEIDSFGRPSGPSKISDQMMDSQKVGFHPPTQTKPRTGINVKRHQQWEAQLPLGTKESGIASLLHQSAENRGTLDSSSRAKAILNPEQTRSRKLTRAAGSTYMTRGSGVATRGDLLPYNLRLGALQSRRGRIKNDTVTWMSGVRVEKDSRRQFDPERELHGATGAMVDPSSSGRDVHSRNCSILMQPPYTDSKTARTQGREREDVESQYEHNLQKEIIDVTKTAPQVSFEEVDIAKRSCTLSLYGPWANHGEPVYLRLALKFSKKYPRKPPKFDLEHNASVFLKTRAFLLRSLTTIQDECTHLLQGCISPCASFLAGASSIELDNGLVLASQAASVLDDSDDDEDGEDVSPAGHDKQVAVPALKRASKAAQMTRILPGAQCGASWGLDGRLVVFRVTSRRDSSGLILRNQGHEMSRPTSALDAVSLPALDPSGSDAPDAESKPVLSIASLATSDPCACASSVREDRLGAASSLNALANRRRFLRSYAEITRAMDSLTRMGNNEELDISSEGGDIPAGLGKENAPTLLRDDEPELLALMSTDFLARRLQTRSSSKSRKTVDASPQRSNRNMVRTNSGVGGEERGRRRAPPPPLSAAFPVYNLSRERTGRATSRASGGLSLFGQRSRSVIVGSSRRDPDRARHLGVPAPHLFVTLPPLLMPSTTLVRGRNSEVKLFHFDEAQLIVQMLHEGPPISIASIEAPGPQPTAGQRTIRGNGEEGSEIARTLTRPDFYLNRSESSPVAASTDLR